MKYDVYRDLNAGSLPEQFELVRTGVTAEFICELTGRHFHDFNEDIQSRGFNEFEVGRDHCALAVPVGRKIPTEAYIGNR